MYVKIKMPKYYTLFTYTFTSHIWQKSFSITWLCLERSNFGNGPLFALARTFMSAGLRDTLIKWMTIWNIKTKAFIYKSLRKNVKSYRKTES